MNTYKPTLTLTPAHGFAFNLQASIALALLASSSAPTPLYPRYQEAWGFSAITTTLIFGVYALMLLSMLLIAGRLSDYLGRRPLLIVSTLGSALAMLVFADASSATALFWGRALQGVSTGIAVTAVGAGLLDIHQSRGTIANALAPISGTAVGGLMAGLAVHFLPYPTILIYVLNAVVFVVQCIGVVFMVEPTTPRPGALASLRPQFSVPKHVRGSLLIATPMLIAAWGLPGFYASLGPGMVKSIFGLDSALFGGIALSVMMGSGAAAILLLIKQPGRVLMYLGSGGMFVGTLIVLFALHYQLVVVFFLGSALAGAGFGAGFQGSIRMIIPNIAPHERAGALSVLWVISYLALATPSIGAGIAIANGAAVLKTSECVGILILLLTGTAFIGMLRSQSR
jgi:MFS family permease